MRRNLFTLFLLPLFLLTGCEVYQSTAPWWEKSANITLPGIEGRWISRTDRQKSYVVKRAPSHQGYDIDIAYPHEQTLGTFVTFARFDNVLVADATSRSTSDGLFKLPVHMVFLITLHGREATVSMLTNQAMKKAAAKYRVRVWPVKYSDEDTRDILCENSSMKLTGVLRYALKINRPSKDAVVEYLRKASASR